MSTIGGRLDNTDSSVIPRHKLASAATVTMGKGIPVIYYDPPLDSEGLSKV